MVGSRLLGIVYTRLVEATEFKNGHTTKSKVQGKVVINGLTLTLLLLRKKKKTTAQMSTNLLPKKSVQLILKGFTVRGVHGTRDL